MKPIYIILLLCNVLVAKETSTTQAITHIKMLEKALKVGLKSHLKEDKSGLSALNFCSKEALHMTNEINAKLPSYATVKRTALKVRNEQNRADKIDIEVMNEYLKTHSTKLKVVKNQKERRVYKPLYTMGVCLKCHGSNISKPLQEMLAKKYPKDEATHFKAGSLRGVIVSVIQEYKNR